MLKLQDYDNRNTSPRKRETLWFYPACVFPNTDLRTTTTTAILRTISDVKFGRIKSSVMGEIGARLNTNGQYIILPWRVPDDYYNQEAASVRFIFALNNTTTTVGGVLSPVLVVSPRQIGDINLESPTPEYGKAAPTDTSVLDKDITFASTHYVRRWYRSEQGSIAAQALNPGDLARFKLSLDAAPTGGLELLALGIEVDYWLALRDGEPERIQS